MTSDQQPKLKEETLEQIQSQTLEIIDNQISKITDSFEYNFKMITLGSAFTGKTCFLSRFFKNLFDKTTPTITIDFYTKSLLIDSQNVMITAFDTAGSENYMSITSKYVRDKHCLFFVFDLT